MGRTSIEAEDVIDVLDDLVTFGYLYEAELRTSDHLGRLSTLSKRVGKDLRGNLSPHTLFSAQGMEQAICSVMNQLQAAVKSGAVPNKVDFDQEWANKPLVLTGALLHKAHIDQAHGLVQLVTGLVHRLDTAFPPEAKQFITREQVRATVQASVAHACVSLSVPIHIDTLAGLLHQSFLSVLDAGLRPMNCPQRWRDLTETYQVQAMQKLFEMAKNSFYIDKVRELFSNAKELYIGIDRYYPWGALWEEPMQGKDWLQLYAQLNASGAVKVAKFRPSSKLAPVTSVADKDFISWGKTKISSPTVRSSRSASRIYFNTDDADIRIDDNAVQKRAVMAIRYDKPLRDIEKDLRHFGMYLLAQRKRHCANDQTPLSAQEDAMARNYADYFETRPKSRRTVLHDKSSVLAHLCALLFFQRQRDPQFAGMSSKAQTGKIHELVSQAGFRYGIDTIRKACSRREKEIEAIKRHLETL